MDIHGAADIAKELYMKGSLNSPIVLFQDPSSGNLVLVALAANDSETKEKSKFELSGIIAQKGADEYAFIAQGQSIELDPDAKPKKYVAAILFRKSGKNESITIRVRGEGEKAKFGSEAIGAENETYWDVF